MMRFPGGPQQHQFISSLKRCCSKNVTAGSNIPTIHRTLVYSSRRYIPPHRQPKHAHKPVNNKRAQNHVGGIVVAGMALAGGLGGAVIMAQSEGPDQQLDDTVVDNIGIHSKTILANSVWSSSSSSSPSSFRERDFPLRKHNHGKTRVRILKVIRDDPEKHVVCEYNVETKLFCEDYAKCFTKEDNTDLIATDTQRNTVYVVAKRCGPNMTTPEDFGIALCQHFLEEYAMLDAVEVKIHQVLWERVVVEDSTPQKSAVPHPHAFIKQAPETYACQVQFERHDGQIKRRVTSSIQKMTILKTTQSGFEGYLNDKYTLLPPTRERCLATEMDATWTYEDSNSNTGKVDYAQVRYQVRRWLLQGISPPSGVYSASLQATIYDAACLVLDHVPQVSSIQIDTPNLHYLPFVQLNQLGEKFEDDIFLPTNEPSGSITCTVTRN